MSAPCHTELPRHDVRFTQGGLADDSSPQQFFVEWEVPQDRATPVSDYRGRPDSPPVDLRGIGAFLVGDFDLISG